MLAYYVEWHMRQAPAPLLFHDEELDVDRARRDPVAPAQPSQSARRKKHTRLGDDGLPLHSLQTLLAELTTRCRNTAGPEFELLGLDLDRLRDVADQAHFAR